MKSFFQRNKSHDPPPPAPSAKHHRSASAQPELRRTARAPSVRGVPASQPLHRTDRPDSPSRERQHADKLRSSSRAPRPPPEQTTTSSSYPERTAHTNGIAHPNGNAHLNGTYPGDSRSRAPKTYDAQSILERRREELPIPVKPIRTKAPSIFEVPAAALGKTTSTRDDRERRARRHVEEPREEHDDRERARDKEEDRYGEKEAQRRDREERHRLREVQRQEEEKERLELEDWT